MTTAWSAFSILAVAVAAFVAGYVTRGLLRGRNRIHQWWRDVHLHHFDQIEVERAPNPRSLMIMFIGSRLAELFSLAAGSAAVIVVIRILLTR